MRVVILSKACIVGQYQTKLTALAAKPDIELTVIVPPEWRDERGTLRLERRHTDGYNLIVAPMRWNGHFHLHYYPTLPEILTQAAPDIFHIDEEPYNLATYRAMRTIQVAPRAHTLFFSWQNILKKYPPPFSWMEQYVYHNAAAAIAGNAEAETILRRKGFQKTICIIPQFGVPPSFFPDPQPRAPSPIVIGYAGRLVHEKGITLLMNALSQVQGDWQLQILGSGPLHDSFKSLAQQLHIDQRVQFAPWVSSDAMPRFYNSLDLLVVPSLTQPNWKEQFGRVIMEAMACGIPVIGSSSGEIPNVIGDAGIIFPEGNITALVNALNTLIQDPMRRQQLGAAGRARALTMFSQQRVVDDTFALYQRLL